MNAIEIKTQLYRSVYRRFTLHIQTVTGLMIIDHTLRPHLGPHTVLYCIPILYTWFGSVSVFLDSLRHRDSKTETRHGAHHLVQPRPLTIRISIAFELDTP